MLPNVIKVNKNEMTEKRKREKDRYKYKRDAVNAFYQSPET
jgi:hypothetical protein